MGETTTKVIWPEYIVWDEGLTAEQEWEIAVYLIEKYGLSESDSGAGSG